MNALEVTHVAERDVLGGECVWPGCTRDGAVVRLRHVREAVTTLCETHRKDFWRVSS